MPADHPTGALVLLEKAAAAENAIPMEFRPPSLSKPANELIGLSKCAVALKDAELEGSVAARLSKVKLREALQGDRS